MFFINHREIEGGGAAVIEIEGPLNSETTPDFEDYTRKLIESGMDHILLDMKKLTFISSEGIGAALMLHRRITSREGAVVFFNLNSEAAGLFRILGFNRVFTIAESASEAAEIMKSKIDFSETSQDIEKDFSDSGIFQEDLSMSELPEPELTDFNGVNESDDFDFSLKEDLEPFVIECLKCGSLVRIKEKGPHICPFCDTGFDVSGEGKAVFKID